MKFDKNLAASVLREEASLADSHTVDNRWVELIEHFSESCQGSSKTHIAFLGTAILAKALNSCVDVFAVKVGAEGEGAYSARGLGHGVLVPLAAELGINLGVTGREPLNNQPYFRIKRVSENMPVRGGTEHIVHELCEILKELESVTDDDLSRRILRSFIFVRRQYLPGYLERIDLDDSLPSETLLNLISTFVAQNSEGGKRAQAVVAGLMDLFADPSRVQTGRINDPDRHLPGDVGIRSITEETTWEKVFEVRDKPVALSDVFIFASKVLEARVQEAAIIAVSSQQQNLDFEKAKTWAKERGLALSLFTGWSLFVKEALFWSEEPQISGAKRAAEFIYGRLIQLEVSELGINEWQSFLMNLPSQTT